MNPRLRLLSAPSLDSWRDTADVIEDARYCQVRVTFRGDAASGQTAELEALAITWSQN